MCTGALSNAALLLMLYPEVMSMVEITLMGGCLGIGNTHPVAEFNIVVRRLLLPPALWLGSVRGPRLGLVASAIVDNQSTQLRVGLDPSVDECSESEPPQWQVIGLMQWFLLGILTASSTQHISFE